MLITADLQRSFVFAAVEVEMERLHVENDSGNKSGYAQA